MHDRLASLFGVVLIGAGLWFYSRRAVAAVQPSAYALPEVIEPPPAQGWADALGSAVQQLGSQADAVISDVVDIMSIGNTVTIEQADELLNNSNVRAFLAMIRAAEGTAGSNGYRTLWGGGRFDSFADHPRQLLTFQSNGKPITSSAAGAYQFLSGTWDDARRALGLTDFSPQNQDRACVWLLARRRALDDILAGRFDAAVSRCAREWASLPGSPYGQPVKTLAQVRAVYQGAGGTLVA